MGQDVDGFCAILRAAGYTVLSKEIPFSAPRLGDLPGDDADGVLAVYRELGGVQQAPRLAPGSWDLLVHDVLVELDEQLHFNRYRAITLDSPSYRKLPLFPVETYRTFCSAKEPACLKAGTGQKRWTSESTEAQFGPCAERGDLSGGGAPRWKQRAIYDLMKDLTQLEPDAPALARISIWDRLPGQPGVTVEAAVHRTPTRQAAEGLRCLIEERSGRRL
jgi:hypothetical protein